MSEHIFYSGLVRHRRFAPIVHDFNYHIYMLCLDLDHLVDLLGCWPLTSTQKPALGWFRRSDYVGPADMPLKQYVLNRVNAELGLTPQGKVTLLTHLRLWGVLMNPIAVFCCYDSKDRLAAVALQVTNTPWGEQCLYVLKADPENYKQHFVFDKTLHVSPYHPMDMRYQCRLMHHGDKLVLHLENHHQGECKSDATLVLQGRPLTQKKLHQALFLFPYMTAKVYYGIYKQAFSLFLKNNPVFTNPSRVNSKQQNFPEDNYENEFNRH